MGEQTVTSAEVLHDSKSELQELGVSAEQAAEVCRKLGEAWAQATMTIEAVAPAFCRWIRKVAAEVVTQHEMKTALRWATCQGWKCSPARGLTAGTPGATKPRKHRRNGKCLIF